MWDDFETQEDNDYGHYLGLHKTRNTQIQIALSAVLGLGAFLTFCILRTRWPTLYAARKQQRDQATLLPELPNTLFGWMPVLWRVTENQVLAAAGLDAYVFLRFFKMGIKFLLFALFFALTIIKPVHDRFGSDDDKHGKNKTRAAALEQQAFGDVKIQDWFGDGLFDDAKDKGHSSQYSTDYLWMYLVFTYLFTGFALYLLVVETRKVISVRQMYLGSQTTVTDRTIRLSGVPPELRSEHGIKAFIEDLEVGKVENVLICRDWKELDDKMAERNTILRRLEESWTVFLGRRRVERNLESLPVVQPPPPGPYVEINDNDERSHLLGEDRAAERHVTPYARSRPTLRLRSGPLKLRYELVDAIDHYEEKLRDIDEKIEKLRSKEFTATPLAFVTLDSVSACQMAIQAVLDPSPLQLQARPSPAPADIVWRNTYLPRTRRMAYAWSITVIIAILTVFWSVLLIPIVSVLDIRKLKKIFPSIETFFHSHDITLGIVQTQLTTLLVTLLNILGPYLYEWLSNWQGMVSQGDIELSAISKNFFFLFFNFFLVFTVFGTAALTSWSTIGKGSLRDFTEGLATSLATLREFYTNYIILQGLGLFPFRLLEFGSVSLYPISLLGAKTPRDYAELVQPPVFSYALSLPNVILIFMVCIVYSVLETSWLILLAGLVFFCFGYFCYKYQLLYAMDHRQHATGKSWTMICDRIIVGIVVFQLTMAGQLALRLAIRRSIAIFPLLIGTLWFAQVYGRSYKPLMTFIALKSIKRAEHEDESVEAWRREEEPWRRTTVDEHHETGMRFVNPNMVVRLDKVWIKDASSATVESVAYNGGTRASNGAAEH